MDDYREVQISEKVSILVPPGLSPEQEANFIASRKAAFDPRATEREMLQAMADVQAGKLVDLQTVLNELRDQWGDNLNNDQ